MMKKVIVVLSLLFALTLSLQAQEGEKTYKQTPEEKAAKHAQKFTESLSLSADQTKKVEAAILTRITTRRANQGKEGKEARKEAKETFQASMKEILTDEQHKTYLAQLEEKKDAKKEQKSEKLTAALNLTDEQEEEVIALHVERKKAMKALKDSGERNPKERKAITADFEDGMKEILDDTQWAKFQEMKEEKKENRKGKGKKRGRRG